LILVVLFFAECATINTGLSNKYSEQATKNLNADKVSVLFIFSHYLQTIGYEAIPELDNKYKRIDGFDDFF